MIGQDTSSRSRRGRWIVDRKVGFPSLLLRSLTLKLTLAFLCVGLIGALLVALFVAQMTQRAFYQFVADRGRATLIADLAQYYRTHKGWDGVGSAVEPRANGQPGADDHHVPAVVIDVNGQVVLGGGRFPSGTHVAVADRSGAVPISVNGHVVGWLLPDLGPRGPGPGSPEANLLAHIRQAILYSALGATAIALLLGVLLARTLTHPIRELTDATRVVAKGALGQQVTVRSRDELGTLAASFNRMSTDLAHASTLRRQMTADIAHDLRTPLSVILGYTEALRDGKLPAMQEVFDTLHTEAQHLQHLVDDLRTLSLADAGELTLVRQRVMPQALVERTAAAYRAQADAQQVSLVTRSAGDLPEVDVDPERIAQVLGNLLSNALRYTPAGGTITIDATRREDAVQLCVDDTGAGIAPEALPHVFERFYRADPSRQQEDGSSGLGLAIAKSIVEAHGGTIGVESTPGRGTSFTITLPIPRPASSIAGQRGMPAAMSRHAHDL